MTREDLEIALAEAGGEEGMVAAFVQPMARPVEPVLFGRRLVAFAIDALLLLIALAFVHGTVVSVLGLFTGALASEHHHVDFGWWWVMPWGYHDPGLGIVPQALIAIVSAATVLGYFTWFEGYQGRLLGKRAMELRVARVDGGPISFRESFIRNLAKLSPHSLSSTRWSCCSPSPTTSSARVTRWPRRPSSGRERYRHDPWRCVG